MLADAPPLEEHDPAGFRFYRDVLACLDREGVPFLVGGAYALGHYTGIVRHTKDLDLFTRPADAPRVLDLIKGCGYRTEMTFAHWLAKAFAEDDFVDVIFSSGNGMCPVDDGWFAHAPPARMLGHQVRLIPAEEMIGRRRSSWSASASTGPTSTTCCGPARQSWTGRGCWRGSGRTGNYCWATWCCSVSSTPPSKGESPAVCCPS
jgi:hypothetical protein